MLKVTKSIAIALLLIAGMHCLSSCKSSKIISYSRKNAYNSFNKYVGKKEYLKDQKKFNTKLSKNKRKRLTPRFHQNQFGFTFARKTKHPQNSIVKICYPYEFVFLFLGKY